MSLFSGLVVTKILDLGGVSYEQTLKVKMEQRQHVNAAWKRLRCNSQSCTGQCVNSICESPAVFPLFSALKSPKMPVPV